MSPSWLPHWGKGEHGPGAVNADDRAAAEPAEREGAGPAEGRLPIPISADLILESLKDVEDPELGIGIVDLGLIYGIDVEGKKVRVRMTLTSPGCPIGPMLQTAVHGAVVRTYPNVEEVKVDLVWSPPWDPYKMASEEAKDMLGIW